MASELRTVVVDAATRRAVSRALLRVVLTRPGALVLWGVCAFAVIVVVVVVVATGRAVSPFACAPALFVVGLPVVMALTVRFAVHRSLPLGGTVGVRVGDARLTVETPGRLGQTGYGPYRDVRVSPGAVVLIGDRSVDVGPRRVLLVGRNRVAQGFPRAVFTDADIDELRARIGAPA